MKTTITFILPTLNRKKYIVRAINSCLGIATDSIQPFVIVIDSRSDDGSFELISDTFRDNEFVKIIQNSRDDKFMKSCFLGVTECKTDLVTFMYDDDLISPYFGTMVSKMLEKEHRFIMAYGKPLDADSEYNFQAPESPLLINKDSLLLGYFGQTSQIPYNPLPVSPICCCTTLSVLQNWVNDVQVFCDKTPFRNYFLMQRNIGPDLMIYLKSILEGEESLLLIPSSISQLSAQRESMSVVAKDKELDIGYWLAKVWLLEAFVKNRKCKDLGAYAGFLLFFGFKMMFFSLKAGLFFRAFSIFLEEVHILSLVLKSRVLFSSIYYFNRSLFRSILGLNKEKRPD